MAAIAGYATLQRFPPDRGTTRPLRVLLRIGTVLMAMAFVTITFNAVRVTQHATLSDIFLTLAAFILLLAAAFRPTTLPRVPVWLIGIAVSFIAIGTLSSAFSSSREASAVAVGQFWLALFAVPALIVLASSSFPVVEWFADLWVISAAANAAVSLLDFLHVLSTQKALLSVTYFQRASGLTVHPNHLGIVCAMALPITATQALTATSPRRRILHAILSILIVFGLLASGSRAAFVAAIAGMIVLATMLFRTRRRALLWLGIGTLVAVLLALVVATVTSRHFITIERLLGSESVGSANSTRLAAYQQAVTGFIGSPLVGVGFQVVRQAHDVYLQLLQAGGLFALVLFVALVILMLRMALSLSNAADLQFEVNLLVRALTVSVAVFVVNGLFENQISDRFLYIPFGLILAVNALVVPPWRASKIRTA